MTYPSIPAKYTPKLILNAGLFADDEVLLVKYANRPDHQQGWFIPHVYLAPHTHPDDAIKAGLRQQLNLDGLDPRLTHVESFVGNDGTWHLPLCYKIKLEQKPAITTDKSIAEFRWFALNALPERNEVAHHGWALDNIEDMTRS